MPVAKRYSPSGVNFKRWQAAGKLRSCMSSIRLLKGIVLLISRLVDRRGSDIRRKGALSLPEVFILFQAACCLSLQPLRCILAAGDIVHLQNATKVKKRLWLHCKSIACAS